MSLDRIGDGFALRSKGDIISHDGTANIVIPSGTNGQILTAQSSTTSGLEWVNGPTTPTEYWIGIASATVSASGVKTVTFSSIPSTYDDLVLIASSTGETSMGASVNYIEFNTDTVGENYHWTKASFDRQSTNSASLESTVHDERPWYRQQGMSGGYVNRQPTVIMFRIYQYSSTSLRKPFEYDSIILRDVNNYLSTYMMIAGGQWESASAITSITVRNNDATYGFETASRWHLYGIKRS